MKNTDNIPSDPSAPTQGGSGVDLQRLVRLVWSDPAKPCEECRYDHTIAETPFGRFLLTWKSWKSEPWQDMGLGFDETPWGEVHYDGWNTVEDAQQWAEKEMTRRCAEFLKANKRAARSGGG